MGLSMSLVNFKTCHFLYGGGSHVAFGILLLQRCQPLEILNLEILFFSLPPPPPALPPPNCPSPQWNDKGHYMKSYIKYMLSKFANHCFDARNNLCHFVSD